MNDQTTATDLAPTIAPSPNMLPEPGPQAQLPTLPAETPPVSSGERFKVADVIAGLHLTYNALMSSPDKTSKEFRNTRDRLLEGCVRRAKIKYFTGPRGDPGAVSVVVNNLPAIEGLLRAMPAKSYVGARPRPDGCMVYTFPLPENYVGYTPMVTFADIQQVVKPPPEPRKKQNDRRKMADQLTEAERRRKVIRESVFFYNEFDDHDNHICTKHYAPSLAAIKTTVVSFVMDHASGMLIEWHAGQPTYFFPPASQWIHLAVDLFEDHEKEKREKRLKPVQKPT
jgi:hypothetical protein